MDDFLNALTLNPTHGGPEEKCNCAPCAQFSEHWEMYATKCEFVGLSPFSQQRQQDSLAKLPHILRTTEA